MVKANPDSTGRLLYHGKPGIAAIVRGEVLQVLKCEDVSSQISLRQTPKGTCFYDIPITYKNEEKFLNPDTKVITDESSIVSCKLESSIHQMDNSFISQQPNFEPFEKVVKVLSANHLNQTLFPSKVAYQLGGLHGKVANKYTEALLTAFARKAALKQTMNTVIAQKFPDMPEFSEEDTSWLPNFDALQNVASEIMEKLNFYSLLTMYSIIGAIVVLWILAIIAKAMIHGISSPECWQTIISLFIGIWNFIRFFLVLFRIVAADNNAVIQPTAPIIYQQPPPYYENY